MDLNKVIAMLEHAPPQMHELASKTAADEMSINEAWLHTKIDETEDKISLFVCISLSRFLLAAHLCNYVSTCMCFGFVFVDRRAAELAHQQFSSVGRRSPSRMIPRCS